MRPVCCACACEMRCCKNEVMVRYAEDSSSFHSGDRYRCPACGFAIVTGISDVKQRLPDVPVNLLQEVRSAE